VINEVVKQSKQNVNQMSIKSKKVKALQDKLIKQKNCSFLFLLDS